LEQKLAYVVICGMLYMLSYELKTFFYVLQGYNETKLMQEFSRQKLGKV